MTTNIQTTTRRNFIKSSAAMGLCMSLPLKIAHAQNDSSSSPNIVLIMADDLGYETIGVNGCAEYQTPNLDQLAQQGARFTNCHVNPLCTPTRCAIMTGRYNYRNYYAFGHLHRNEITFAHMLKNAGYATAAVGKWQLGNGSEDDQSPAQAGFDEYCLWNIKLGDVLARDERYADANLIYLNRENGSPEFQQFNGEYGPDVCKNYLFEFMENSVERQQPLFAYFPMILTHNPFKPTPNSPQWESGDRHEDNTRYFKDMVEYMDKIVGDITTKLDELGVRENTLVMFLGDNGTHQIITTTMKDGSVIQGGKALLTDAGTHVPFIANWPGTIPEGQVIDDIVDPTDFLPTLAETAGASLTQPQDGKLDGVSFLPQLKGEKGTPREWILIEYYEDRHQRNAEGRFVRNQRWKLYDQGTSLLGDQKLFKGGEFYDLLEDPNEETPLKINSLDGKAKEIYEKFRNVLKQHPLPEN